MRMFRLPPFDGSGGPVRRSGWYRDPPRNLSPRPRKDEGPPRYRTPILPDRDALWRFGKPPHIQHPPKPDEDGFGGIVAKRGGPRSFRPDNDLTGQLDGLLFGSGTGAPVPRKKKGPPPDSGVYLCDGKASAFPLAQPGIGHRPTPLHDHPFETGQVVHQAVDGAPQSLQRTETGGSIALEPTFVAIDRQSRPQSRIDSEETWG